jgi:hypothetical protein
MRYDVDVLKLGREIDIKVHDAGSFHHFTVKPDSVRYEVMKDAGRDPVAISPAELVELQDDRILVRTATHLFEVVPVPGPNGNWQAYKSQL